MGAEVRETSVIDLVEAIVIETLEIGEVVVDLHTVDQEMMTVVVPEMMIDVDQEMMTVAVQEMTTVVDQEMMIADLLVTRDPWTGAVDLEDPLEMTTAVDLEMTTAVDLEKMTAVDLEMMTVVDPVIDQPEIKMTAGRRSTSVKPSSLTSRVLR